MITSSWFILCPSKLPTNAVSCIMGVGCRQRGSLFMGYIRPQDTSCLFPMPGLGGANLTPAQHNGLICRPAPGPGVCSGAGWRAIMAALAGRALTNTVIPGRCRLSCRACRGSSLAPINRPSRGFVDQLTRLDFVLSRSFPRYSLHRTGN